MAGNQFGEVLRITSFGESHGAGIGVVLDGCPAGLEINLQEIQKQLSRRRPGQSELTTARQEQDELQVLSGLFEGQSTGAPIALFITNTDQRPKDYSKLKDIIRPGHADYTYTEKYGIRDHRGGGRSSARETAARVMAGSIAEQLLALEKIRIIAFVDQVGDWRLEDYPDDLNRQMVDAYLVRCPDSKLATEMDALIRKVKAEGDSIGGSIKCIVQNCPVGLGEPVFDRLEADLAKAMLSINASKGFEIGSGFKAASMLGSENNDRPVSKAGSIHYDSNHSGGVLGGISSGQDIVFRVAFKPVSTIGREQNTVNLKGEKVKLQAKGRHDPCVVPRAVPIVESMAALVIADHLLRQRLASV